MQRIDWDLNRASLLGNHSLQARRHISQPITGKQTLCMPVCPNGAFHTEVMNNSYVLDFSTAFRDIVFVVSFMYEPNKAQCLWFLAPDWWAALLTQLRLSNESPPQMFVSRKGRPFWIQIICRWEVFGIFFFGFIDLSSFGQKVTPKNVSYPQLFSLCFPLENIMSVSQRTSMWVAWHVFTTMMFTTMTPKPKPPAPPPPSLPERGLSLGGAERAETQPRQVGVSRV